MQDKRGRALALARAKKKAAEAARDLPASFLNWNVRR
jgi:hypothetical protein